MNYEDDIKIDELALDIEWLDQPRLMLKYTKYQAETRKQMDLAKERLELVKAELDKKIRSDPESYGIRKVTETVVTNTIVLTDDYQKAVDDYLNAKFEYDVASGIVKAFEQRKSSLENLVRLFGQEYFAGPSAPRDISKEWEIRERQKRANKKIKIRNTKKDEE